MRLNSCHIEHFGNLQDLDIRFDEDLHVILRPNGWGKSTLAAFVRVMFYGFEGEGRRSDTDNERLSYRPWGGGIYGGSVTFTTELGTYILYRTFGSRRKEDTFRLMNAATGLDSEDYTAKIGEELFAIDAASFRRTVFFGQMDLKADVTAPIRAKIGNLAGEEDDMRAFDRAHTQLTRFADRLSPDRANGLIRRHREELSAMDARLSGRDALAARGSELAQQAAARKKTAAGASADMGDPKRKRMLADRLNSLDVQERILIRQGRVLRRRHHVLSGLIRSTEDAYAEQNRRVLLGRIALASVFVLAVLVILFVVTQTAPLPLLVLLLPAAAAGWLSVVSILRAQDAKPAPGTIASMRKRRARYGRKMRFLAEQINSLRRQRMYLQSSAQGELPSPVSDGADGALRELEDVRASLREMDALAAEREALSRTLETEVRQREIALKTADFLSEARDSLTSRYMPPFIRAFRRYYELLTGESAELVQADAALSVSVLEAGSPRDPAQMSAGTRDLIDLCRRLAMVDAMYPAQKPFLIMDDPFVNLDDDKIKGGLRLLHSASHDYQILYFTCHRSRAPQASDLS